MQKKQWFFDVKINTLTGLKFQGRNRMHQMTKGLPLALDETATIWQGIIEKISHSFVNKLSPLNIKHTLLQGMMPSLLKAYQLAVTNNLIAAEIDQRQLDAIASITNIAVHTEPMFNLLQALCALCDNMMPNKNTEPSSAKDCIEQLLNTYPFKENERDILQIQIDNDFKFNFPKLFLESSLREFLNIAFNNMDELELKRINLYFGQQGHHHTIHFTIVSKAIQAHTNRLFLENYLAEQTNNIVPGIQFCRLALLYRGGNIMYQLNEGNSLEFTIFMPLIDK